MDQSNRTVLKGTCMAELPNFICIGAPKSGTTALYEDLAGHPQIFLPAIKETHFFRLAFGGLPWGGPGTPPLMHVSTMERYCTLFDGAEGFKAVGEICPSYFAQPEVADHIRQTLGQIKILILLRHPAERAFSQFLHARLIGCEPEADFLTAAAKEAERRAAGWGEFWYYLGQSFYAPVLERYFTVFGRSNVLTIRHDYYVKQRVATLAQIYRFIGVDPGLAESQVAVKRRTNVSGLPDNALSAALFRNIEVLARIARRTAPKALRHKVRSLLDKSLVKVKLEGEARQEISRQFVHDLKAVEVLTGWDLSAWKV